MEIKTYEEACAIRGYDPAKVLPDVSVFPVKHQKSLLAFAMLVIIAEAINEGWEPDWNDGNERKWFPWFDMEVDGNNPSGFRFYVTRYVYTFTYSSGGSRLCFKTEAKAEYAGKTFVEYYRDLMVIPK